MKKKITVRFSSELLTRIDGNKEPELSRSLFIENVLREFLWRKEREAINARDLELINANADALNAEVEDVLQYQAPIDWDDKYLIEVSAPAPPMQCWNLKRKTLSNARDRKESRGEQ